MRTRVLATLPVFFGDSPVLFQIFFVLGLFALALWGLVILRRLIREMFDDP